MHPPPLSPSARTDDRADPLAFPVRRREAREIALALAISTQTPDLGTRSTKQTGSSSASSPLRIRVEAGRPGPDSGLGERTRETMGRNEERDAMVIADSEGEEEEEELDLFAGSRQVEGSKAGELADLCAPFQPAQRCPLTASPNKSAADKETISTFSPGPSHPAARLTDPSVQPFADACPPAPTIDSITRFTSSGVAGPSAPPGPHTSQLEPTLAATGEMGTGAATGTIAAPGTREPQADDQAYAGSSQLGKASASEPADPGRSHKRKRVQVEVSVTVPAPSTAGRKDASDTGNAPARAIGDEPEVEELLHGFRSCAGSGGAPINRRNIPLSQSPDPLAHGHLSISPTKRGKVPSVPASRSRLRASASATVQPEDTPAPAGAPAPARGRRIGAVLSEDESEVDFDAPPPAARRETKPRPKPVIKRTRVEQEVQEVRDETQNAGAEVTQTGQHAEPSKKRRVAEEDTPEIGEDDFDPPHDNRPAKAGKKERVATETPEVEVVATVSPLVKARAARPSRKRRVADETPETESAAVAEPTETQESAPKSASRKKRTTAETSEAMQEDDNGSTGGEQRAPSLAEERGGQAQLDACSTRESEDQAVLEAPVSSPAKASKAKGAKKTKKDKKGKAKATKAAKATSPEVDAAVGAQSHDEEATQAVVVQSKAVEKAKKAPHQAKTPPEQTVDEECPVKLEAKPGPAPASKAPLRAVSVNVSPSSRRVVQPRVILDKDGNIKEFRSGTFTYPPRSIHWS